jgi:hypothetical protein
MSPGGFGPDLADITGSGGLMLTAATVLVVFLVYLWHEHSEKKWERWQNREREDADLQPPVQPGLERAELPPGQDGTQSTESQPPAPRGHSLAEPTPSRAFAAVSGPAAELLQDLAVCEAYLRERGLKPVCDRRVAAALQGVGSQPRLLNTIDGGQDLSEGMTFMTYTAIARAVAQDPNVVWITSRMVWSNPVTNKNIERALTDGQMVGVALRNPRNGLRHCGIHLYAWENRRRGREIRSFLRGADCRTAHEFQFASFLCVGVDTRKQLFDWCRSNMSRVVIVGRMGRKCYVPWLDTDQYRHSLLEITENREACSRFGESYQETVRLRFAHMAAQPPFADVKKRRELIERLRSVPGIEVPPDALRAREYEFPLKRLDADATIGPFLGVLDWAIAEMKEAS